MGGFQCVGFGFSHGILKDFPFGVWLQWGCHAGAVIKHRWSRVVALGLPCLVSQILGGETVGFYGTQPNNIGHVQYFYDFLRSSLGFTKQNNMGLSEHGVYHPQWQF